LAGQFIDALRRGIGRNNQCRDVKLGCGDEPTGADFHPMIGDDEKYGIAEIGLFTRLLEKLP